MPAAGGRVTYRLSITRQSAPVLVDQAGQILGFTPRWRYVKASAGIKD
jgi:hypothetical protein